MNLEERLTVLEKEVKDLKNTLREIDYDFSARIGDLELPKGDKN